MIVQEAIMLALYENTALRPDGKRRQKISGDEKVRLFRRGSSSYATKTRTTGPQKEEGSTTARKAKT